jgi:hypothetical protein
MKIIIILSIILITLFIARISRWYFTSNVERPATVTTKKHEWFEIRTLPEQIVATVTVTANNESEAAGRGFQALAGFIFGDNVSKDSIAMTAPVTSQKTSEKIAMTAPVTSQWNEDGTYEIGFIMPSEWTMETLPVPNNKSITISQKSSYKVAVWTFWGYAKPADVAKKKTLFQQALTQEWIQTQWNITLAQYNDPWTPPRMRTNELWVQTKE